jgi:ribosome maturation protein Sdo1
MNEELTRKEVIEYFRHCIEFDNNFSMNIDVLEKAIEYIQQAPKYRKKAKRWKRKYMSLLSKVERIRAEIAEDMANAAKEAKQTQDDIDCGITIGLQMALDTVNKYRTEDKGGTK